MKKFLKITVFIFIFLAILSFTYIKGLPSLVSNEKFLNYVQNTVRNSLNAELIIKNPQLKTGFKSDIDFTADEISIEKEGVKLLELRDIDTAIALKITSQKVIIKRLIAESLFADADGLMKLNGGENTSQNGQNNWQVDLFDSLLGVKNLEILYSVSQDAKLHLKGENIAVNNANKGKRNVYFQLLADIKGKNKPVTLKIKDNGNVYFENEIFHVENCPLSINKSDILINLTADRKQNFDLDLSSKKFNIPDIIEFLNTKAVENNIDESLVYFNDIRGNADFDLNIKNDDINGKFKLNSAKFKVKDVDNIPITLTKGQIDLTSDTVKLTDFEGFYDNNPENKISFDGTVKDYLKTIDTNIEGKANVTNDFFKTYLSNMTETPLEIKGNAPTKITLKSKNNIMDFNWFFMLKPGQNIKVGNDFLPFEDSLRFMSADMHLENNILDIKSLDYHMVEKDKILSREEYAQKRAEGEKFEPIFRLKSSLDLAHNNYIKFVKFEIPKPLQSEILNPVLGQEIFKKGLISGNITLDNSGKYPVLDGSMQMDKVLIPIQKMYIKSATLDAKKDLIHANADGRYRRAKFNFNGDVVNALKYPMVIKDLNLSLENLDVYKMLEGFNNQNNLDNCIETDEGIVMAENTDEEFDVRNIIIEKCNLRLDKGNYKEINFANLDADLTLDKNGVVDIKSNRFDFAEGESSLRAKFDLVNKKYNVKLGVLNVNSDTIAKALLDLNNEISGKASGFLDLTTDDTMRMGGSIKFLIKDGAVEKIGLVQYVLKFASLFRNTITMINPATVADIVNVPEGNFDKITGELKLADNVVTSIKIKTFSPDLSTYVAGRYNIDNGDTSLRIYTKFCESEKGLAGILRKFSLNSLAKSLPLNSKNDANYYAIELKELPEIDADEKDCQIFLTRIEGDVVNNNYISSLKKIK